jgi:hypothetical protein
MATKTRYVACPHCGGDMVHTTFNVPTYGVQAYCLSCGYGLATNERWLGLAEVNELREAWGLPPLFRLAFVNKRRPPRLPMTCPSRN